MIGPAFSTLLEILGTIITGHLSDDPSVIAEVRIRNMLNTSSDNGTYILDIEEMSVEVEFTWNAGEFGADRITLIPPLGVICDPSDCSALVLEGFDATILLKPYEGF